jgi:hypothetical protein
MDDLAKKRRQLIVKAAGLAAVLGAYMIFPVDPTLGLTEQGPDFVTEQVSESSEYIKHQTLKKC